MKAFFFYFLLIYFSHNVAVMAEPGDLCRLLADGTQFRSPGSCSEYITCHNQSPQYHNCMAPSSMYDRNKNTCVESASDCDKNYCNGVNGKWVANPNNCNGFYYCANGVPYAGYCEIGFHFDESKQQCSFESTSTCVEVPNICEFLPDKTKLRDENDCGKYYECSSGKKSSKTCKNTYFDVESGSCVEKHLVLECSAHAKPKCTKKTLTGTSIIKGFQSDGVTCRGYFHCRDFDSVADLQPQWGQCPEGTYFNAKVTKTLQCTEPIDNDCANNRCDARGTMYVQAATNDCRDYIVCENNIPVDYRTCNGDKFFDEKRQACVANIIEYPSCVDKPPRT